MCRQRYGTLYATEALKAKGAKQNSNESTQSEYTFEPPKAHKGEHKRINKVTQLPIENYCRQALKIFLCVFNRCQIL